MAPFNLHDPKDDNFI